MHPRPILAPVLVALLGAPAAAQTFEPRIAYRDDHLPSNVATRSDYTLDAAGTYDFQVLFGGFAATGFTNRGTFSYKGDITISDPAGSSTIAPRAGAARRNPYADGVVDGVPGNPITFFANRSFAPIILTWPEGEPMPGEPSYPPFVPGVLNSGGAADEYFPGYRFTVTITSLEPRAIRITSGGSMNVVRRFSPSNISPPDGGPGVVEYYPDQMVTRTDVDGTLTITIAPSGACAADWNSDGLANSSDVSAFLTSWLWSVTGGDTVADFSADGMTNSGDISAFLAEWVGAVGGGC